MTKPFTDSEVEHLLSFIGYGNPDAPVWFLGMEEGGGGEENLRKRLEFERIEDLYEGHKKLGILKHHEEPVKIQSTWQGMCVVMLKLLGNAVNGKSIQRYQADQLGRKQGETFLVELMPLPKPSMGDWDYENLLPQFGSPQEYYEEILPKRQDSLRTFLAANEPEIVVAYGKEYWQHFRKLFPDSEMSRKGDFLISNDSPFLVFTKHLAWSGVNDFYKISELIQPVYDNASA